MSQSSRITEVRERTTADRALAGPFGWRSGRVVGLVVAVGIAVAYGPVWGAGFVWDDSGHVTRTALRSLHGLWRIWFEPGATQQYYPVLHSAFWIEHRLWGDSALGYHLANLGLHLGVALLLYRVLVRLSVPGAFLAAVLFAVHPVCVESVAWISEEKNTLSSVFYLSAALAYLRFDGNRRAGWYALGIGLFGLALLSKSVTATLPAALLVVLWWKRGRLSLRGDVLPLVPWLLMGAAAGLVTAWMERTFIGANGARFDLGPLERLLIAGRAVWFYLGKILWPAGLTFIYPHWSLDARAPGQWLYPLSALAALAALYALRGRSRGPLASALLFTGTLFPALGFINVFPFIYSYVADHFQYLAAAMAIAAAAAGLSVAAGRLSPGWRLSAQAAAACVAALLGALTWRQARMYSGAETLWLTTIARNPACWMAYNNLGIILTRTGRVDAAVARFQKAIEIRYANAEAHTNLANAYLQLGRTAEAYTEYQRALEVDPASPEAHYNFGNALLRGGRVREAIAQYHGALERRADYAEGHNGLGAAFLQEGRLDEAAAEIWGALQIEPDYADARFNMGNILARRGRADEAAAQYARALAADPGLATAHVNLGNVLVKEGRLDEAIAHYRRALEIDPGNSEVHHNLGIALLGKGRMDEAKLQFDEAARTR